MVSSLRFISLELLFVGSNGVRCKDQISCNAPQSVGTTQAGFERLKEASSLTLSTDKQYLYTANDSGAEKAEVFAINKNNGQVAKVFSIIGIRNERHAGGGGWGDHECMIVNNCPHDRGKKCIYVGDTGYNWVRTKYGTERSYPQSFIVFEEPRIIPDGSQQVVHARRFPFTFPNKQLFDVEACVVQDSLIHVFTKNTKRGYEYSHVFTYQLPVDRNPTTKTAPVVELKPDSDNVPLFIQFGVITGATTTNHKSFILRSTSGDTNGLYVVDPASAQVCKGQYQRAVEPCYLQLKRGAVKGLQEAIAYDNQNGQHVLYTLGEGSRELYKTICSGSFFNNGHAKSECHTAPSPDGAKKTQTHGTLPRPYQDDDEGSDDTRPPARKFGLMLIFIILAVLVVLLILCCCVVIIWRRGGKPPATLQECHAIMKRLPTALLEPTGVKKNLKPTRIRSGRK